MLMLIIRNQLRALDCAMTSSARSGTQCDVSNNFKMKKQTVHAR